MLYKIEEACDRFIRKFNLQRYLRTQVVFVIDLVMSLLASLCAFGLVSLLSAGSATASLPLWKWVLMSLCTSVIVLITCRTYRAVIRYSTLREVGRLAFVVCCKEVLLLCCFPLFTGLRLNNESVWAFVLVDLLFSVFFLLGVRVIMVMAYDFVRRRLHNRESRHNVLIYGTDDKSAAMLTRLRDSDHYVIVGFLMPGESRSGHTLSSKTVYYFNDKTNLKALADHLDLDGILFAYHQHARSEQNRLMLWAPEMHLKTYIAPPVDETSAGHISDAAVRKIKIEDLLGRSEIKISLDEVKAGLAGKTILVTGAAGSIGSELCRQLAGFGVKRLVMFDNAETPLHNVRLEFEENYPDLDFIPVIGDVRQPARLDFVFRKYRPQVVFHAAAYKHVPLMEENPCEAVLVNVAGSRNVADKCVEYDAEKMVMISTDKAVNPTNIMGCTKRLAEIYVQSLGLAIESGKVKGKTRFITTRFGNVLGSNGSVIPRFRDQIAKGGPLTVTHPEIQRFFMTIPEACRLVMEAATIATGTEIFVFDMGQPVKIADLARSMVRLAGLEPDVDIKIEFTGLRPGEKLYEEVLATKENTIPTSHDRIFVACVRKYDHDEAAKGADRLTGLAETVDIPDMVILMKRIVPEFISKHSPFECYDHPAKA